MANLFFGGGIVIPPTANISVSTIPLNSAYTYDLAGNAIAFRFMLNEDLTLTDIYGYLHTLSGTAANVNDLNWKIRDNGAVAGIPGTSVIASGTYDPSGDSPPVWMTLASGLSQALVKQKIYHLILADADGNGTDYATVVRNGGIPAGTLIPSVERNLYTFGGYNSAGIFKSPGGLVLSFSDNTSIGGCYTVRSAVANNTLERGLKFQFDEDVEVLGCNWSLSSTSFSGVKIYEDGNNPGGTTVLSEATSTATGELIGVHYFDGIQTLTKGKVYRLIFTYSANGNDPYDWSMITTAPAKVQLARFARNSNWCYTVDNGAGGWTDRVTSLPSCGLIMANFPAVAGGGGRVLFKENNL